MLEVNRIRPPSFFSLPPRCATPFYRQPPPFSPFFFNLFPRCANAIALRDLSISFFAQVISRGWRFFPRLSRVRSIKELTFFFCPFLFFNRRPQRLPQKPLNLPAPVSLSRLPFPRTFFSFLIFSSLLIRRSALAHLCNSPQKIT